MWYPCSRDDGGRYLTVKGKKCCLLIGNSRWHWAIEQTDEWHYFHTTPDLQALSSLEIPITAWAAVGQIPKTASLDPSTRLQSKDVPIKKMPHWIGIDRALATWAALQKGKPNEIKSWARH